MAKPRAGLISALAVLAGASLAVAANLAAPPPAPQAGAPQANAGAPTSPAAGCALGALAAEPQQAAGRLALCKTAAKGGDLAAQKAVGDAYFNGAGVTRDRGEARKWYDMAARQKDLDAMRKLGAMYASGDGGKKDTKKALELWQAGEKAGDPLTPILVADQLFSNMTGGRKPEPGQYKFKGGVPTGDIDAIIEWYTEAAKVDPRPDMKARAEYALKILASLKQASNVKVDAR